MGASTPVINRSLSLPFTSGRRFLSLLLVLCQAFGCLLSWGLHGIRALLGRGLRELSMWGRVVIFTSWCRSLSRVRYLLLRSALGLAWLRALGAVRDSEVPQSIQDLLLLLALALHELHHQALESRDLVAEVEVRAHVGALEILAQLRCDCVGTNILKEVARQLRVLQVQIWEAGTLNHVGNNQHGLQSGVPLLVSLRKRFEASHGVGRSLVMLIALEVDEDEPFAPALDLGVHLV